MEKNPDQLINIKSQIFTTIDLLSSLPILDYVKSFSNSSFTTSLVGALAGAFAGAWAAKRIAESGKIQEELTKEIRNVNAAMTTAHFITNAAIELKNQHLKSIVEKYNHDREQVISLRAKKIPITNKQTYGIQVDLRNLRELTVPIELLQEIVHTRLTATERPLSLVSVITASIKDLSYLIQTRDSLIEMVKSNSLPHGIDILSFYFSLEYGEGHRNDQYKDCIQGASKINNDLIFYSALLCDDLRKHGLRLAARYEKSLKKTPPSVNEVNLDELRKNGTIPPNENYPDWFSAFQQRPKKNYSLWQRLKRGSLWRKKTQH